MTNMIAFQTNCTLTFCNNQHSSMGTSMWHALVHVVKHMRRIGVVSVIGGAFFQNSHKVVKEDCKLTSRRRQSAMRRLLRRGQEKGLILTENRPWFDVQRNEAWMKSNKNNTGLLIKSKKQTTLYKLSDAKRVLHAKQTKNTAINKPKISQHVSGVEKRLRISESACLFDFCERKWNFKEFLDVKIVTECYRFLLHRICQ